MGGFLRKAAAVLLLSGLIVMSGCGNEVNKEEKKEEEKKEKSPYGFQVGEDGFIYLDGNKFYGMGFNWHGGFSMALDQSQRKLLPKYFEALSEAKIPFVRTMLGAFYASDVELYLKQREKWFDAMDCFVSLAEEYHVGIVASFWKIGTYQELCGEDLSQIGNPYSKGSAIMKQMMTEIIQRYKDSPAIWAWEIANEGNLACEVSSYEDKDGNKYIITSEIIRQFYEIASKVIRENDPDRMITNGDGGLRESWKSLKTKLSWDPPDTEEDYDELFEFFTPGDVDSLSIHYPNGEQIKKNVERSRKLGIGLFIGEFHSEKGFTTGKTDSAGTEEREGWEKIVRQMLDADVQVMCHWCWGRCVQQWFDGTSVEIGLFKHNAKEMYQNYYVWERVQEINNDFVLQGKNNSEEYWNKYGENSFKGEEK